MLIQNPTFFLSTTYLSTIMAPSFDDHTSSSSSRATAAIAATAKRGKLTTNHPLLPGLPDHIAPLCLSLLPPATLFSVCRSWRRFIYSDHFPAYLSLYTLSSDHNSTLQLSSFDPISSKWTAVAPSSSTTAHLRRVCLHHPSFISRNLSIQSVSVSGHLILLAGTSSDLLPALSHPLVFNPLSKTWSFGPPLSSPRRWCAAGVSRAAVVVASGFGSQYTQTVSRAVEKWVFPETEFSAGKGKDSKWVFPETGFSGEKVKDSKWVFRETDFSGGKVKDSKWVWKKMKYLRDGGMFSREAINAVGCKGKLYMVTCGKEGVVYDVDSDGWSEMAEGMLGGWRGPAAAMDEEMIYMVDESKGVLRKYDDLVEMWVDILENDMLKGAEHIAAGGGRVCVVRGGGGGILVVDVVASPPRLWVVETLAGHRVLGLHILPRMCPPEFQSPAVV